LESTVAKAVSRMLVKLTPGFSWFNMFGLTLLLDKKISF
jgi:hypothetical protein